MTAFRECDGQILVIVDDDNFLEMDYLEVALSIAQKWPQLGAWGGSITGEFEEPPSAWLEGLLGHFAIRPVIKAAWTNVDSDHRFLPYGAGMCLRRIVAEQYTTDVVSNPLKRCLGRCGHYHISGEDPDIACTAFDLGLGVGLFPELKMRHLIPAGRFRQQQTLQIMQGNYSGFVLMQHLRGHWKQPRRDVIHRVRSLVHYLCSSSFRRKMTMAFLRGERAVLLAIHQFEQGELRSPEEFRAAYVRYVQRRIPSVPW